MRLNVLLFTVLFIIGGIGGAKAQADPSVCAKDICVKVDVVSQLKDMQRGLQGAKSLAKNHGMLFVFDSDNFQPFWMKDMKFAIDMIWIDSQYRIVTIASSCPACVQEPCKIYVPSQKARYVLEVSSGFALRHHFKLGDVLTFKGIS